jgi:hypothetical protein
MPRKKFCSLKEAVVMIFEEDDITDIDLVVLPYTKLIGTAITKMLTNIIHEYRCDARIRNAAWEVGVHLLMRQCQTNGHHPLGIP